MMVSNPFEAPDASFGEQTADVVLALVSFTTPQTFSALLTKVCQFREQRLGAQTEGGLGGRELSVEHFVERELGRLLERRLIRRRSSIVGPVYVLVARDEALAWLRQHHAARLPVNLHG